VWDGEALAPEAIRQMLNASLTELTGLNDAGEAWVSLFNPGERIAIEVNTSSKVAFLTSFEPVAHDTIGLQMLGEVMVFEGIDPTAATDLANVWLANSAELGLGANDPNSIELVKIVLG
jgi:hypothetical protein